MNFQDIREELSYFIGGVAYLAMYLIFTAVSAIARNSKDISGWYLLVVFTILTIICFIFSIYMLTKTIKSVKSGASKKHNYPFWISVWGDIGYLAMAFSVLNLFG